MKRWLFPILGICAAVLCVLAFFRLQQGGGGRHDDEVTTIIEMCKYDAEGYDFAQQIQTPDTVSYDPPEAGS